MDMHSERQLPSCHLQPVVVHAPHAVIAWHVAYGTGHVLPVR